MISDGQRLDTGLMRQLNDLRRRQTSVGMGRVEMKI
jgi:hypothetical protein